MMLRLAVPVVSLCVCLGPGMLPVVPGSPAMAHVRSTPPLCLAAEPHWSWLHARCPVMPGDPFESVGARLWLLHVR